jgi:hypothetical protein
VEEAPPFVRLVVLPLPPIDLAAMIAASLGEETEKEAAADGETGDSTDMPQGSIANCVASNRALCEERLGAARCDELAAETGPVPAIARDIMELLGCQ